MGIDYIYRLLGMKEVELNATRTERDQLKAEVKALKKQIEESKAE